MRPSNSDLGDEPTMTEPSESAPSSNPGPTDQRVEQVWETPPADEIVELTKAHVDAMEQSDHEMIWSQAGMHHVLLQTTGRKSGKAHKVALPVWFDRSGHRIVVASFAGATKHPSWFVNLRDTTANPSVYCKAQHEAFWSVPEILTGAERSEIWQQLVADRAWYTTYQEKTEREIPLVRLAVSQPA